MILRLTLDRVNVRAHELVPLAIAGLAVKSFAFESVGH